jgi:hypothetical protein
MNIELTYMETLDLRMLLNQEIENNNEAILRYANFPNIVEYHVVKNERFNLLITKLEKHLIY